MKAKVNNEIITKIIDWNKVLSNESYQVNIIVYIYVFFALLNDR